MDSQSFSLSATFDFSVKSGQIRNIESARVSMGGQVKKYVHSVSRLYINRNCMFHSLYFASDIRRCEESTSSPVVPNSIGEGIIEEEEEEEVEEESNKKRMKEDDQEV